MQYFQHSIFQLLTSLEQIVKSYQQNSYEIEQIQKMFKELQKIKISPEIIFQQLISGKEKIAQLKYTLYKQIMKIIPDALTMDLISQNQENINYNKDSFDSFLNLEDASEILRKISAIKSQIMFVNQQLSIQRLENDFDNQKKQMVSRYSLRKIIKEYMKKTRANPKIQFLMPLCIRLIVLQQSITLYLQKSLAFLWSIIDMDYDSSIIEQPKSHNHTIKSFSSLSASLQQFIQKQNKNSSGQVLTASMQVQQCRTYRPIIQSDFVLHKDHYEQPYITVNRQPKRNQCCLWF